MIQINFDMDGTIADLYGVPNWLDYLKAENTFPYEVARPLMNLSVLARQIHRLQNLGCQVNIISWLSKCGTPEYNEETAKAKREWLAKHLPSVTFNNIYIVPYGTPKYLFSSDFLFDDEENNRTAWETANETNIAFGVENILEILRNIK